MSKPSVLHPGEWPERNGRPRVLVESPDRADLWAHAETLREAGFDVAVCAGPDHASAGRRPETLCPLLTEGRCPLTEGADVIVTSADMPDTDELIRAHTAAGSNLLVEAVAAAEPGLGKARIVKVPVTEQTLLAAVTAALSDT